MSDWGAFALWGSRRNSLTKMRKTKRDNTFKRINGSQLPDYLSVSLSKNSDVHSRNTRNCNVNLLCPSSSQEHLRGRTHLCCKNCKGLEQSTPITKNKEVFEIL